MRTPSGPSQSALAYAFRRWPEIKSRAAELGIRFSEVGEPDLPPTLVGRSHNQIYLVMRVRRTLPPRVVGERLLRVLPEALGMQKGGRTSSPPRP